MRAKTRLQHKVVTANGRLLPQTKKQELWAFRQCISHYAYRTKNGGTTCMDCGYQWNESNEKVCRCPHCGARLEILDTKVQDIQGQSVLFHTCHTGRFTGTACISYERKLP